MADIEFQGVSKIYPGGTRAVESLDLTIREGELMVFVGPSGCGKTTALRMVAGLEEISEGAILIGGEIVNEVSPKERDIAMVFQNYALYPHMTVAKNLAFGLKLRKLDKAEIERRVRRAAETLGLEDYLDRKPRALSGGQRQRVAMGRAIVREPRAFLMDEPLSNLDAKLRVQVRAEIQKIQRTLGVTTIYVTHDQTEAMTMGDRIAVMRDGTLQQVDTPEQVYQRPANEFVAGFIGSPAMNMVRGRLTRVNGSLTVGFGEHSVAIDDETITTRPALLAIRRQDRGRGDSPGGFRGRGFRPRRGARAHDRHGLQPARGARGGSARPLSGRGRSPLRATTRAWSLSETPTRCSSRASIRRRQCAREQGCAWSSTRSGSTSSSPRAVAPSPRAAASSRLDEKHDEPCCVRFSNDPRSSDSAPRPSRLELHRKGATARGTRL